MIGSVPIRALSARCLFALTVIAPIIGGCGGGSTYSYDEGGLAQQFLPTERTVAHHPDSLEALTVSEREDTYQFELENDYEALHRKWSSTYQEFGTGRSQNGRSYATLWSLELSLASLQPEVGITSLTRDRAQKRLRARRQEYRNTIQVEVYWFEAEGDSRLAGPGTRVRLRVGGEKYRPSNEDAGPLREGFLPDRGQTALYRRNTFYFSRIVDGRDILRGAEGVELQVDRGGGSRVRFAWSWEGETKAALGSGDRGGKVLVGARDWNRPASDSAGPVRRKTVPTYGDGRDLSVQASIYSQLSLTIGLIHAG